MSNRIMFRDIVHPDDTERTKKEIQDYVSKGIETYKQIYRIVTRNGDARWIEDHTSVVTDPETGIKYHQGIVGDDLFNRHNYEFETELMSGSGASVQVLIHGNTLYGDTGTIIGNVVFVTDMTEAKKALRLAGEVQKNLVLSYGRSEQEIYRVGSCWSRTGLVVRSE